MSQDVERLLADVGGGEDMSDTSPFMLIERLMEGVADDANGVPFPVIDRSAWREASDKATVLFEQSKDLRLAAILCRSWMVLRGLAGLRDGLELVRRLLADYWDVVHPRPYDDEPDNFQDRLNALASLNDYSQTMYYFRDMPIIRVVGGHALTPRIFCLASGRLIVRSDEDSVWSLDQLRQAIANSDPDEVKIVSDALAGILSDIYDIRTLFREKAGSDFAFDLKLLTDDIKFLAPFFQVGGSADTEVTLQESPIESPSSVVASPAVVSSGSAIIASRADIIATLEKLCDFMERHEPAHPAPLFMRRAQRLLSMSFMEIIEDLTPDALDTVRNFKGRGVVDDD